MSADFSLSSSRLATLRHGAVVVLDAPAVFRIEGPGALTCLQGLLTSDLAAPGDGSLTWGALLTPKGMIVFDIWVAREGESFTLVAEAEARAAAAELFRRTLPPRLARVRDLSDDVRVAWLLGPGCRSRLAHVTSGTVAGAGRVFRAGPRQEFLVGAAGQAAPFSLMLLGAAPELEPLVARLGAAGIESGGGDDLAAARMLAGWPTLGREIDEKTLPQEARFDELGGVSYSKGCYTGQETVARVHFRGHVNRVLRGVTIDGAEPISDRGLRLGEKEVGILRTTLRLEDRTLGLATLRREVEPGSTLRAGDREARVITLPFAEMETGALK